VPKRRKERRKNEETGGKGNQTRGSTNQNKLKSQVEVQSKMLWGRQKCRPPILVGRGFSLNTGYDKDQKQKGGGGRRTNNEQGDRTGKKKGSLALVNGTLFEEKERKRRGGAKRP